MGSHHNQTWLSDSVTNTVVPLMANKFRWYLAEHCSYNYSIRKLYPSNSSSNYHCERCGRERLFPLFLDMDY